MQELAWLNSNVLLVLLAERNPVFYSRYDLGSKPTKMTLQLGNYSNNEGNTINVFVFRADHIFITLLYLCVCMAGHVCIMALVWRSLLGDKSP